MANEKRLIDADALMDSFREYMVERYDKEKCVSEENCKTCDKPCLWRKIVRSAPTVSAVEVKRGRWGKYGKSLHEIVCSNCGGSRPFFKNKRGYHIICNSMYCPHCGAKMN